MKERLPIAIPDEKGGSIPLADYVRNVRKYCGMTQKEFANSLLVSLRIVQSWENGKTKGTPMVVYALEYFKYMISLERKGQQ